MPGKRFHWVLAVLLVTGSVLVLLRGGAGKEGLPASQGSSAPEVSAVGVRGADSGLQSPTGEGLRKSPQQFLFHGRVVDESGTGIVGASVVWSPLPGDLRGDLAYEWPECWSHQGLGQERAETGSNGRFAFDARPLSKGPKTFVWIAKSGFESRIVVLASDVSLWPNGKLWVLEPKAACRVRVVDSEGKPVAGAQVSVRGRRPERLGFFALTEDQHGQEFFAADAVSDGQGEVSIPRPEGRAIVQASLGERVSSAWQGVLPEALTLRLRSSFSVQGSVEDPVGGRLDEPAFVRVEAWRSGLVVRTYSFPIGANGDWGPSSIPLQGEDRFAFSAGGRGWNGTRVSIEKPDPGSQHRIDLIVTPGADLWGLVTDGNGEPIANARLSVRWSDGVGARMMSTRTFPDGYALLRGCPLGPVMVEASAEGFAGASMPWSVLPGGNEALGFSLSPGGHLSGRCTAKGEPQANFDILGWSLAQPERPLSWSIRGAQDGSFSLSGVPLGEFALVALGPAGLSSDQAMLDVEESTPPVRLELSPDRTFHGRVVGDGGDLLSAVFVQTQFGGVPVGSASTSDASGAFSGTVPHSAKQIHLLVKLSGYADLETQVPLPSSGDCDLGTLVMRPVGKVVFRLITPEGLSPTDCTLSCRDCDIPKMTFDSQGLLNQAAMAGGGHGLWLELPANEKAYTYMQIDSASLEAHVLDLAGKVNLSLELRDVPEGLQETLWGTLTIPSDGVSIKFSRMFPVGPDEPTRVRWIRPDVYTLSIKTAAGEVLANQVLDLTQDTKNSVEISLATEGVPLRIVDSTGQPLAGAEVDLHHGTHAIAASHRTDQDGRVRVQIAKQGPAYICVLATDGRAAWDLIIPEHKKPGQDYFELVCQCTAQFRVQLFDGGGLLQGQSCKLLGASLQHEVSPAKTTDANGQATFSRINSGEYIFSVHLPDHWPFNKIYQVSERGSEKDKLVRIRIPRLADLTVQVQDAGGRALAGEAITIWSMDYDKDVKRWWEAGALDPEPADWRSDANGLLHLPVMPEGRFRISVPASAGHAAAEVQVEIRPGAENLARLVVR